MHFPVQRKIGTSWSVHLLLVPVIMLICAIAIFGEGGILHGYSAKVRLNYVTNTVRTVEYQNDILRRQIQMVQENPRVAKQLIAQNMLWVTPKTSVYRFEHIEQQSNNEQRNLQGWITIIAWLGDEVGIEL
ncbi:MAG: hypothetical protein ACON4U_08475 [Myxococcota bacterium]